MDRYASIVSTATVFVQFPQEHHFVEYEKHFDLLFGVSAEICGSS